MTAHIGVDTGCVRLGGSVTYVYDMLRSPPCAPAARLNPNLHGHIGGVCEHPFAVFVKENLRPQYETAEATRPPL